MAIVDGDMVFGLPAITNSNTATISTNVYDAGSAKKVFGGPRVAKLCGRFPVTADASPTVKVDFIGADAADLNTLPVVIASTGVIASDEAGALLATAGIVDFQLDLAGQTAAKRYYGCKVTLGGTNPDTVAAAKQLYVVLTAQTNLPGDQAAIPAT